MPNVRATKNTWPSCVLGLLRVIAVAMCCFPAFASAEGQAFTFGVVPQYEQRKLFTIWKPIVDALEAESGLPLKLVATLTVKDFEHDLSRGAYDFVFANPYHILRERARQGYIPLVRDKAPLRGILLVRKDSQLRTPEQLDGKTLAVPSLNALGASLLVRADLERLHNAKMKMVDVKTHSAVYLHVANGLVDAGGGVEKTFGEQERAVQDALRILYVTREMPSHPVASHPRVPKEAQERLRQALLRLSATPQGRALLEKVPIKEVVETSIKEYATMEKWGLESYWINQ